MFRRCTNIMRQGRSPFLLTCDHYGRLIPRALGDLGLPESELTRHIAWDIGIAGVAELLSKQLDAHLIAQRYSRLVIDCNRPPHVASSIPLHQRGDHDSRQRGHCRARPPRCGAREIFDPYHRRIDEIIDARRQPAACRPCWCRCTALRPSMPASRGPGTSARSITATRMLPPLLLQAFARRGRSRGRRQRALCGQRRDRLHHPRARRGARPDEHRHRDPPGPDRRSGRRAKWADRLARIFGEIEPALRAERLI